MAKGRIQGIILGIALVIGLNMAGAAWSNPASAPTAGNPDVPVNVGNVDQTKNSQIGAAGFVTSGDVTSMGSIGIGTITPKGLLHIRPPLNNAAFSKGLLIEGANHASAYSFRVNNNSMYIGYNGNSAGGFPDANYTTPYNFTYDGKLTAASDVCNGANKCLSNVGGGGPIASYDNLPTGSLAGHCELQNGAFGPIISPGRDGGGGNCVCENEGNIWSTIQTGYEPLGNHYFYACIHN